MTKEYTAFRELVNDRGRLLKSLTYEQLRELEDKPAEYVSVEKRRGRIAIHLDKDMPSGGIRVVVQGFLKKRFFPMVWSVAIDGFYKYPDETTASLTREDTWEFD